MDHLTRVVVDAAKQLLENLEDAGVAGPHSADPELDKDRYHWDTEGTAWFRDVWELKQALEALRAAEAASA